MAVVVVCEADELDGCSFSERTQTKNQTSYDIHRLNRHEDNSAFQTTKLQLPTINRYHAKNWAVHHTNQLTDRLLVPQIDLKWLCVSLLRRALLNALGQCSKRWSLDFFALLPYFWLCAAVQQQPQRLPTKAQCVTMIGKAKGKVTKENGGGSGGGWMGMSVIIYLRVFRHSFTENVSASPTTTGTDW